MHTCVVVTWMCAYVQGDKKHMEVRVKMLITFKKRLRQKKWCARTQARCIYWRYRGGEVCKFTKCIAR